MTLSAVFQTSSEASVIRSYECQVIPGILQTPDYADAIFRPTNSANKEIDRLVKARMERQNILNRVDPPHFMTIIDEAALHRLVGSVEVMRTQLRHLTHMASRYNIDIYVLPFKAGRMPQPPEVS